MMKIVEELKNKIEEQKKRNIEIFKSIPVASYEDPTNMKAQPILDEWRKGSEIIKAMIKELQELECTEYETSITRENNYPFVNSYGEATKRNITCAGYERADRRNQKAILSLLGNR